MSSYIKSKESQKSKGFTIVELLVVIVILAILTAISIVVYTGVTQRAVVAKTNTDAANAVKSIAMYETQNGALPSALEFKDGCSEDKSSVKYICLGANNNGTDADIEVNYDGCIENGDCNPYVESYYEYTPTCISGCGLTTVPTDYTVNVIPAQNPSVAVEVSSTNPTTISKPRLCHDGFVLVPGNNNYGTNDFCVMKFEAKKRIIGGSEKPISIASGLPWTDISQSQAIEISSRACDECHLITEAEWMTIADNVIKQAYNWQTGVVGSGSLWFGHMGDLTDYSSLQEAVNDDSQGFYGVINEPTDARTDYGVRRTFKLSNSQYIWDLSGNAAEWTQGKVNRQNTPTISGNSSINTSRWNALGLSFNGLALSSVPSSDTISNYSNRDIGYLYSQTRINSDGDDFGIMRGGCYNINLETYPGIYTVDISYGGNSRFNGMGSCSSFRVAESL